MAIIHIKVESAVDVDGMFCGRGCPFFSTKDDKFFCQLFGLDLSQSKGVMAFSIDRCEPCLICEADSQEKDLGGN